MHDLTEIALAKQQRELQVVSRPSIQHNEPCKDGRNGCSLRSAQVLSRADGKCGKLNDVSVLGSPYVKCSPKTRRYECLAAAQEGSSVREYRAGVVPPSFVDSHSATVENACGGGVRVTRLGTRPQRARDEIAHLAAARES